VFDKWLLTFWYREVPEPGDLLDRIVQKLMKYSILVFCLVAGVALSANYCMTVNQAGTLTFANEYLACRSFWGMSAAMVFIGIALLLLLLCIERYFFKIDKMASTVPETQSYFQRISNLDRKRWLAEEVYRRQKLNLQLLSDQTFEALCQTPGSDTMYHEPPNYDPTFNTLYNERTGL
jgi:hypothetical protein